MRGTAPRSTDPIVVVFRRRHPSAAHGGVLALFPTEPADDTGRLCMSYMLIGQHGGADYYHCIAQTRPATPAEYGPILAELRQIGYADLRIRCRSSYQFDQARRAAAREYRP